MSPKNVRQTPATMLHAEGATFTIGHASRRRAASRVLSAVFALLAVPTAAAIGATVAAPGRLVPPPGWLPATAKHPPGVTAIFIAPAPDHGFRANVLRSDDAISTAAMLATAAARFVPDGDAIVTDRPYPCAAGYAGRAISYRQSTDGVAQLGEMLFVGRIGGSRVEHLDYSRASAAADDPAATAMLERFCGREPAGSGAARSSAPEVGILRRPAGWRDVSNADATKAGAIVYGAPAKVDGFRPNLVSLSNAHSIGVLLALPAARLVAPGDRVIADRRPPCGAGYAAREVTFERMNAAHRRLLEYVVLMVGSPQNPQSQDVTYTRPAGTPADPKVRATLAHVCGR